MPKISKKLFAGEPILASVRFKIIQFTLQVLKKITLKFLYWQAKYEVEVNIAEEWKVDLSRISDKIKSLLVTDKSILKDRHDKCDSCENYVKSMGRCRKCGCFMKLKTRMALASCPIGKWNKAYEKVVNVIS